MRRQRHSCQARLGFALGLALSLPTVAWAAEDPAEKDSEASSAPPATPASSGQSLAEKDSEAASPATPLPTPAAPASSGLSIHASWNDRLLIESEDKRFSLQPIAILQSLFTLPYNSAADQDPSGNGRTYEGLGFTLRRAALGFDLHLFRNVRTFFLSNIANGSVSLWDFFADLDYFDGKAVLRVGRFRPWLGRQRLLAGDRYQMIQLPVAMTDLLEFGDGRDLGAGIFGLLAPEVFPVEYSVGVWNGEQKYAIEPVNGFMPSSNLRSRGNIDFEFGSRLVVHPFGYLPAIDESDLDMSEKPRLSVGGAFLFAKRHNVRTPTDFFAYYDDRMLKAGIELHFRWRGFSLEAEAFWRKSWIISDTKNETGKEWYEKWGLGALAKSAYVQGGYFILPRLLEVTGRFDHVNVEPKTPGYIWRPAGGLNLFLHNYNLLLQVMYRANIGRGFLDDDEHKNDFWRSLRPNDRTDVYMGDRPIAKVTHDVFLMLQTSL